MLDRHPPHRNHAALRLTAAVLVLLGLGLSAREGVAGVLPQLAPATPPKQYLPIIPCQSQLGQVWASPTSSQAPTGNAPPLLGFYQGRLTGMVFYLSEKHLYPLLPNNGRWGFTGMVNATVDSITLSPAQLRPDRDNLAYELTVMVHHDTPVTVICTAPNTPAQNQGGQVPATASSPNQGGGGKRSK
jgi:hypothetical protein